MAFTEEQQAVINHGQGHALVRAVAGAGKTHTMVARVRRLIALGVDPASILIIQFNKSAQLNFEARLKKVLGETPCPPVRTFNAVGNAMYKRLNQIGVIPPYKLSQSTALVRRALQIEWRKARGADSYPTKQEIADFQSFIGLVKSEITGPAQVFQDRAYRQEYRVFIAAFEEYERLRKAARQHSFDDQIYDPVMYLLSNPEHWSIFTNRYEHIIVDEFQDSNSINMALLQGLAGDRASLCVIGDANQSIYGFRGSSPRFILNEFQRMYPNTTVYPMTRNFRYGHQTSLMANHLIQRNTEGGDLMTIPMPSNHDTKVRFITRINASDSGLVDYIKPFYQSQTLHELAMLVRYYSASIPYETELLQARIPFHCYGREPLLHLPEIACLYAALCLSINEWQSPDEEDGPTPFLYTDAMLTFPNIYLPEDVRPEILLELPHMCDTDQAEVPKFIKMMATSIQHKHPTIAKNLIERAEIIGIFTSGAFANRPPADVIGAWIALTKIDQRVKNSADQQSADERLANINAFRQMATSFTNTRDMLESLHPLFGQKALKPPEEPHLKIMSIHASKGLEFPHVILPGWTNKSFPKDMNVETQEERRLAYVAITRATHELVIPTLFDAAFNKYNSEIGAFLPADLDQLNSPFLYQAEAGLSLKLAAAIKDPETADPFPWLVRDAFLVKRYVAELGLSDTFTFTEPAVSERYRESRPLPPNFRLVKGDQVWHREHGACTILAYLYDPVYRVKPNSQAPEQMLVISERQGWRLLHKVNGR